MKGFLAGQSFESQSRAVTNERCVNLYPEILPPPPGSRAKSQIVFYGVPGLISRYAVGDGPIQAVFYANGRCFVASGFELYELFSDLSSILRGTLASDGKPVCIASNRFQLCIVSAQNTYLYDLAADTLVNIGVPLIQVRFADGYFIGVTPASQIIRISGQYDGATWNPLDFTSAEGNPDDIVSLMTDHKEIWALGSESIEIFSDSGNPDFPFERIPGALIEQGCAALDSPIKLDNSLFWLGADTRGQGIVWRANGYTPQRVSNHALEYQLSTYPTIADAIGYAYQDQGHAFGVWTFPTSDKTWVYDCAAQLWHERGNWEYIGGLWHRQLAQCHAFAFGIHLVGDKELGIVYEQSINIFDDNGSPKRWLRTVPLGSNENKYLFPYDLEIDLEVGAGIDTTLPGVDPGNPQIMMRYSKDGGYVWGNEKWRGAGKIGQYLYRCRWPGAMGRARKPFVELSGTDPTRIALVDSYVGISGGSW
jgi:hypothetical protein